MKMRTALVIAMLAMSIMPIEFAVAVQPAAAESEAGLEAPMNVRRHRRGGRRHRQGMNGMGGTNGMGGNMQNMTPEERQARKAQRRLRRQQKMAASGGNPNQAWGSGPMANGGNGGKRKHRRKHRQNGSAPLGQPGWQGPGSQTSQ